VKQNTCNKGEVGKRTLYREERYSRLVSRTVLKTSLDWKLYRLSLTKKYWDIRKQKNLGINPEKGYEDIVNKLLKRQDGKCAMCKTRFDHDHRMEIDHIIPRTLGGKDSMDNYQLLHNWCHDTKTAKDGSLQKKQ